MPITTLYTIPIDTWVKVAENVTAGAVRPVIRLQYVQAIRFTGEAAPANNDRTEAVEIPFETGAIISNSKHIDVYIGVVGNEPGKVRVDISSTGY